MSEQKSNTRGLVLFFVAGLLVIAFFLVAMFFRCGNKYSEVKSPTPSPMTMEEAYKFCLDRNGTFEMNGETWDYTCSIDRQQLFDNQRG